MKRKKTIYYILMFLPLLISLIALPLLPEHIPAHYGFDNQVTRWGSKYEALIYPMTTILMGYFLLAMAKVAAKQEGTGKNNEKICIITGIVILVYFNIMNCYMLYTDFNQVEDLSSIPLNLHQLFFGMLGFCMIVIGNVMPKLRMNSFIGLRTTWSLKNEVTWKKSQRFGGITFILAGFLIILVCIFTSDIQCALWTMLIFIMTLIADVLYSYKISLKY